ncbi:unnamed protein product [Rotaria sp. Silwood2]|nr:unnamed protein product [Rotaria sp. Silwood2]
MEEQVEILKHRIHSNCLPPAFNLLDYSLDKIDKILNRSKRSTMNDNDNQLQTILLAHRLKKIDRFKYDMLELSIGAGEEKSEISVQPILASINTPARQISSFLDQLLTPIYNYVTKHITLINSIDVVRKLKEYQQQGYLTSTTLFIIFDVADLYKMIPRDGAIAV